MRTKQKDILPFLLLAFLMPFFFILCQMNTDHPMLQFLFYGLEAASPSIAALMVLGKNKQLHSFFEQNFNLKRPAAVLLLPCIISLFPMFLARLSSLSYVTAKGFLNFNLQFIVILWALFAEELGWRGYLQPYLREKCSRLWHAPVLTGIIWCLWHYHYFYMNGIQVPLLCFVIGCIAESFLYEYLLLWSEGSLLSSMLYHASWNFGVHLFAINPIDNAGSALPYLLMTLFEVCMVLFLLTYYKRQHSQRLIKK